MINDGWINISHSTPQLGKKVLVVLRHYISEKASIYYISTAIFCCSEGWKREGVNSLNQGDMIMFWRDLPDLPSDL